MNEGLDELTGGGALKSQHQTFSSLGHPFSWDLIFLRVLAHRNTLANDLMFLWEVKLKDGAKMAECPLTSVGGCLGLWG